MTRNEVPHEGRRGGAAENYFDYYDAAMVRCKS